MMSENKDLLLEIKDLTIHYVTESGTVHAVEGLNLQLAKGETLGFVGETGAGKTTTALGIMRLLPVPPAKIQSGDIIFEGESLLSKQESQMRAIRGGKIAMIFQDPMTSLDPVVPVVEQIAEMVELHRKGTKADALKRAGDMLELVGIPRERGSAYPHQFSGGMKQRVVIAIALACDPTLLIADEPTTALDVTIQAQVLELMHQLKEKFRTSMIMITHDRASWLKCATKWLSCMPAASWNTAPRRKFTITACTPTRKACSTPCPIWTPSRKSCRSFTASCPIPPTCPRDAASIPAAPTPPSSAPFNPPRWYRFRPTTMSPAPCARPS